MKKLEENKKEIGLYVHIPFCKRKCYYCDFFSKTDKESVWEEYINSLQKEIKHYATENEILYKHDLENKIKLKTIYIGGGTPSIIDANLIKDLIVTIKKCFDVDEAAEITIEVNPGAVDKEKLDTYKKAGINRLSIGLQSAEDDLLKQIGRIHTYKEFEEIYESARQVGFENINVDLMIGLPNQRMRDVEDTLNKVLELKPEHLSIYSLIVEEGTKLEKMLNDKELEMIPEALEREMYWNIKRNLEKYNYIQYEISNYAKPGYESKHNMDCWKQKEYIGIGAGASSFLDNARYKNIEDIEDYIKNINDEQFSKNYILEETLNIESKMKEYMMLGLRKIDGVNILEFEETFNRNPIMLFGKDIKELNQKTLLEFLGCLHLL